MKLAGRLRRSNQEVAGIDLGDRDTQKRNRAERPAAIGMVEPHAGSGCHHREIGEGKAFSGQSGGEGRPWAARPSGG